MGSEPVTGEGCSCDRRMRRSTSAASRVTGASRARRTATISTRRTQQRELRRQGSALTGRFHELGPRVARTCELLGGLVRKVNTCTNAVVGLRSLLGASFPVEFPRGSERALLRRIGTVTNGTVSQVHGRYRGTSGSVHHGRGHVSVARVAF